MLFKSTVLTTALVALSGSALARAASPTSAAPSASETCLKGCNPGDVMCQAACVGTAHPNPSQADATIQCIRSKCSQGDGSAAASEKYSQCVQQCIEDNFPTNQSLVGTTVVPTVTPAPAPATGSSTDAVPATTPTSPVSVSGSGSGSGSGSHKSGSGSGSAKSGSGPHKNSGSGSGPRKSGSGTGSGSHSGSGASPVSKSAGPKSSTGDKNNSPQNGASSNFKAGASFGAIAAIFVAAFAL